MGNPEKKTGAFTGSEIGHRAAQEARDKQDVTTPQNPGFVSGFTSGEQQKAAAREDARRAAEAAAGKDGRS